MKSPNKFKHHLKRLYTKNKLLNTVLILLWLSVATLGVVYAHKDLHKKTIANTVTNNQPNTSSGTVCIAGQPNCNTTKSTTSAQITTPSTPATTTSPQSSSDSSGIACTQTILPYSTTQQNDPSLPAGSTFTSQYGEYGLRYACPGKAPIITPPTTEIEEIGTEASPNTSTPTNSAPTNGGGLTEAQAAQQCDENLANGADGSDPQAYLDQCMHQYGY